MNDIFNIRRFGSYFASDLKKCLSNYGLTISLLSIIGIIIWAFVGMFTFLFDGSWYSIGVMGRLSFLGIATVALVITLPSQCYGYITNKGNGSSFLMIPVSTFEKFLSMTLITAIVLPMIFFIASFAADWLLCTFVPDCGDSLISAAKGTYAFINDELGVKYTEVMKPWLSPWLYIDDFAGCILVFLLGAIIFKKNKNVKTILTCIIVSSIIGMIATPFVMDWTMQQMEIITDAQDPLTIWNSNLFSNLPVLDTIHDVLLLGGLLTAIFFRVKTLKH